MALQFISDKLVKDGKVESPEDPKLTAAFGFCMGLFFEFAWTAKVSVNGKEHRQWSTLRTELQQTMLDASEVLQRPAAPATSESASGGGSGSAKDTTAAVTPLELAEMLCENFKNQPVTSVVWDTEDPAEQVVRNIAQAMSERREEVAAPVQTFVAKQLHLPLMMHPAPMAALQEAVALPADPGRKLVDLVCILFEKFCAVFPSAWCGFAYDCVAAYASHGHFVENTLQAMLASFHSCTDIADM